MWVAIGIIMAAVVAVVVVGVFVYLVVLGKGMSR